MRTSSSYAGRDDPAPLTKIPLQFLLPANADLIAQLELLAEMEQATVVNVL